LHPACILPISGTRRQSRRLEGQKRSWSDFQGFRNSQVSRCFMSRLHTVYTRLPKYHKEKGRTTTYQAVDLVFLGRPSRNRTCNQGIMRAVETTTSRYKNIGLHHVLPLSSFRLICTNMGVFARDNRKSHESVCSSCFALQTQLKYWCATRSWGAHRRSWKPKETPNGRCGDSIRIVRILLQ